MGVSEARGRSQQQQLAELRQRTLARDLEASESAARLSRLQEEARAKDREIEELRRQAGAMLSRRQSSEEEQQGLSAALSERNAQLLQLEREAAAGRLQVEELTRARDSVVAELQAALHQHSCERRDHDKAAKELGRRTKELEETNAGLRRSVFLLEEETKTLKRHLESTSRLAAQEKSDQADRLRQEYLESDEHFLLKQSLAEARKEVVELKSHLALRDKLLTDLQNRLESCERSAMLIAEGKHAELIAKESLAAKCKGYQVAVTELEQQSKVFLEELRALRQSKEKLSAESLRTKTLLRLLRTENEKLRLGALEDQPSEVLDAPADGETDDIWVHDAAQLMEDMVRQLYGKDGNKQRSKNSKKKIVTYVCCFHCKRLIYPLVRTKA